MKTKHEKKAQGFWRFHRVVESLKSYCIKKREKPRNQLSEQRIFVKITCRVRFWALSKGQIPVAVVLSSVPNKTNKTNKHHKEQMFRPAAEDPRSPRFVAMCVSLRLRSSDSRSGYGRGWFDSGSRRTRVIVAIYINYIYTYENEGKRKPQKKKKKTNYAYF